jgi:hypothetical protein
MAMTVLAIDPGNEESAWVVYEHDRPVAFAKERNDVLLGKLRHRADGYAHYPIDVRLAIEMIASYGMPVGREVFETCVWIGRFVEAWQRPVTLVYRKDVKLHLCGQPRAKDGNIRQALIDRWGGKDKAIGRKAAPGPLYGISADVWSALAIAVTYADTAAKEAA